MSGEERKIRQKVDIKHNQPTLDELGNGKLTCPSCSHENAGSALYCEECGTSLKSPIKCPSCGSTVCTNADICESCGTWLLKGQCMFCLAPVDEGQAFCGECGNPTSGIPCPQCGKLSIFDFCNACCIPLSVEAKQLVQLRSKDPLLQEVGELLEGLYSPHDTKTGQGSILNAPVTSKEQNDEVTRLREYRNAVDKPVVQQDGKSISRSLFSDVQKQRIDMLSKEVLDEIEARRIEEERKRREAEERRLLEEERQRQLQKQFNDVMRKLSGKTFSSNQEARRFFMNIIAGLPEDVTKKITAGGMRWRCNAFDCVHDSPSECGDPSQGGVWFF